MLHSKNLLTLPLNTSGRDFVIGDLHGCFDLLRYALQEVAFNPKVDRVFAVGDLIDRGPNSLACIRLLHEPWFFSVRGNHEQMYLDFYEKTDFVHNIAEFYNRGQGMDWWHSLTNESKQECMELFQGMPLTMEVATPNGTTATPSKRANSPIDTYIFSP